MPTTKTYCARLSLGGFLLICPMARAQNRDDLPKNAQLATAAFEALEKKQYKSAIELADECIRQFGKQAERDQESLLSKREPVPEIGKVSGPAFAKIIERGVLNDVASCYFIKGEAYHFLHRTKESEEAFRAASKFTYARTWDPRPKTFWSPSQAALDRIKP